LCAATLGGHAQCHGAQQQQQQQQHSTAAEWNQLITGYLVKRRAAYLNPMLFSSITSCCMNSAAANGQTWQTAQGQRSRPDPPRNFIIGDLSMALSAC
jgi:uncharacterized protein YgiB involved in biofilm formation